MTRCLCLALLILTACSAAPTPPASLPPFMTNTPRATLTATPYPTLAPFPTPVYRSPVASCFSGCNAAYYDQQVSVEAQSVTVPYHLPILTETMVRLGKYTAGWNIENEVCAGATCILVLTRAMKRERDRNAYISD